MTILQIKSIFILVIALLILITDLTHPFCKKLQKGVGILDRTSVLLKNGT
ncbi:MAG: hypothetical protein ACI9JY_001690, partial [Saprospiraceae bacterium]